MKAPQQIKFFLEYTSHKLPSKVSRIAITVLKFHRIKSELPRHVGELLLGDLKAGLVHVLPPSRRLRPQALGHNKVEPLNVARHQLVGLVVDGLSRVLQRAEVVAVDDVPVAGGRGWRGDVVVGRGAAAERALF